MAGKFMATWEAEAATLLQQWQALAPTLGIDVTSSRTKIAAGGVQRAPVPNDGISVREALRYAIAKSRDVSLPLGTVAVLPAMVKVPPRDPCDRSPAKCVACDRDVEKERLCYAYPTCYACLPPPPPIPSVAAAAERLARPNPLRSLREGAGLTQKQMADRMNITRGALANAEKAATASPDMVARARRAIGCRMPGRHKDGCDCGVGKGGA